MTKRDFFRIIFKLFGLYFMVLIVFNYIPTAISYVNYKIEALGLLLLLLGTVFSVGLFILLIRKTDIIIDWLKIDKGFDDEHIKIGNFNGLNIAKFALILIGGFMFLDFLPNFFYQTFLAFKNEISTNNLNSVDSYGNYGQVDYYQWAIAAINLIIGFIILTNYDRIALWLDKKNKV